MSVLAAIAGLAAAAQAQPAARQPSPAPTVSEVVVAGGAQPKLTATFPAQGATVSAGELAVKLVFDRPMSAARWSYGKTDGAAFPVCLSHPRLLADQKTFVLLCQVKTGTAYAIDLGDPPGFQGEGGRDAAPTVLKFSTSGEIVDDLHDALDEAGLTDDDEPIMTWNDDGKTPPKSSATGGR
jgi:hypothetical protein